MWSVLIHEIKTVILNQRRAQLEKSRWQKRGSCPGLVPANRASCWTLPQDDSQKGQFLLILKNDDDLEVVPGANTMFSTYTTFSIPQITAGEHGVWQMIYVSCLPHTSTSAQPQPSQPGATYTEWRRAMRNNVAVKKQEKKNNPSHNCKKKWKMKAISLTSPATPCWCPTGILGSGAAPFPAIQWCSAHSISEGVHRL